MNPLDRFKIKNIFDKDLQMEDGSFSQLSKNEVKRYMKRTIRLAKKNVITTTDETSIWITNFIIKNL